MRSGIKVASGSSHAAPVLVIVVVQALVLVAGCGARSTDGQGAESSPQTAAASGITGGVQAIDEVYVDDGGEKMFPDLTVEDWAQWSSYVLRGTVVGEEKRTDRTTDAGPYVLIGRDVTVEVTDVLWSNPEAVARAQRGDHLTLYTYPGYVVHDDGREQRAATDDASRMEVGADYVVAVMDDVVDGEQVLALMRPVAVEDSDAITVETRPGSGATSIPLREVGSALESADVDSVDPHVGESVSQRWVRYMDLAD